MAERFEQQSEFKEKVVEIRRVTKVVKGGKKMGFRAVVVVGDLKSHVGLGVGKAAEVSAAIRKGVEAAKKASIEIPILSGTIPHNVVGDFSASSVVLRPAPHGTGVIAGGAVRPTTKECEAVTATPRCRASSAKVSQRQGSGRCSHRWKARGCDSIR